MTTPASLSILQPLLESVESVAAIRLGYPSLPIIYKMLYYHNITIHISYLLYKIRIITNIYIYIYQIIIDIYYLYINHIYINHPIYFFAHHSSSHHFRLVAREHPQEAGMAHQHCHLAAVLLQPAEKHLETLGKAYGKC